jgi:hypothetical protein
MLWLSQKKPQKVVDTLSTKGHYHSKFFVDSGGEFDKRNLTLSTTCPTKNNSRTKIGGDDERYHLGVEV